jgi:tetratricopeptide (TPR) repeat protein
VSFNLSKVSYQKEKYSQALEFLKIADFKYPNSSHCGVGIAESANEFALLYNKIYTKLGNTDLALEKLLEQSFEMNNRIILEEINKLLKEKYSKEEIKSEIKNSIKSLKVIPADSAKRTIERYYITLFDKEIEYHNHLDHITSISIKEKIAKSNLFSLISK